MVVLVVWFHSFYYSLFIMKQEPTHQSQAHDQELLLLLEREKSFWMSPVLLEEYYRFFRPQTSFLNWRELIAQWCYDVVDYYEQDRAIVYTTMNLFDRFMHYKNTEEQSQRQDDASTSTRTTRICAKTLPNTRTLEIYAMTALLLAWRMHTTTSTTNHTENALSIAQVLAMSRRTHNNTTTTTDIQRDEIRQTARQMTRMIMTTTTTKALVHSSRHKIIVQPLDILQSILTTATTTSTVIANTTTSTVIIQPDNNSHYHQEYKKWMQDHATYLLEIAVCDFEFVHIPPSILALAAWRLAMEKYFHPHHKQQEQQLLSLFSCNTANNCRLLTKVQKRLFQLYQQSADSATEHPHIIPFDQEDIVAHQNTYYQEEEDASSSTSDPSNSHGRDTRRTKKRSCHSTEEEQDLSLDTVTLFNPTKKQRL